MIRSDQAEWRRWAGPEQNYWIGVAGLALVAAIAVAVDVENIFLAIFVLIGTVLVLLRPQLGVATMLFMFLVKYGERLTPSGRPPIGAAITGGAGLLTINNAIGMILAVLIIYRVYRDNDWWILRSQSLQLIGFATLLLVVASYWNPIPIEERVALGLPVPSQDPRRLIVSRALFLVLFVYFIREPRDLRLMIGIFLALTLPSALGGLSEVLRGGGYAGFRAGGPVALIGGAGNPNRLAMVCTLAIVLIYEYTQSGVGRRWGWLTTGAIAVLVLTVFSTASRGGVVGLATAGAFLLGKRRQRMQRVAFALLMAALAAFLISELVPQETFERLTNIPGITTAADSAGGGSLERRRHTLNIALQIVRDNPVIGIGVGNWEVERFERDPTRSVAVPHNSYLLTWAEGGIFCLAAYLALFWGTVSRLGAISANPTVMARVQRDGLDWVVNALRTCIVSFTVFSLFADLWESIIFYLLIGEAAVLARLYPVRIRRSLMA